MIDCTRSQIIYKPKFGHSSHVGSSTPAMQDSQNHGSVVNDETDELSLTCSFCDDKP